jgi:hypothetical protein
MEEKNDGRIKPGEIRNPHGRPRKEQSLTEILKKTIENQKLVVNGKEISGKDAIAMKLFSLAMQGDLTALKYCYDRVDGTPRQAVELSGPEGEPIQKNITVEFIDAVIEKNTDDNDM